MTMMTEIEVVCGVCGETSKHYSVQSINVFGSSDLDTRPPETERSTIEAWVNRCPSCRYCAPDISKASPEAKIILMSDEYQHIVNSDHLPEKALSFLASSYMHEQLGALSEAAWRAIHAAWVCDDENHHEGSQSCRNRAIILIEQAVENGPAISCQAGATETVAADLLRRSGHFAKALEFIEKAKAEIQEDIILRILEFQKALIENKDTKAHTMAEALDSDLTHESP